MQRETEACIGEMEWLWYVINVWTDGWKGWDGMGGLGKMQWGMKLEMLEMPWLSETNSVLLEKVVWDTILL